ncbi:MAG: hypothetical protein PWP24_1441 [Clostridiales bacterium]|nr:hypothetical protein [Clostridiales bacterium]
MIYIRADANKTIATGHIMRCLSIARQLVTMGEAVTFLVADEESIPLLEEAGFPHVCLHSNWSQLEEELPVLLSFIQERNVKVLLVDSYFASNAYLASLNQVTKVVYFDDADSYDHPVHTVIHYGIQYHKSKGQGIHTKDGVTYLTGCDYIPLREEFRNRAHVIKEEIKDILITTGGTDPYNMAGHLIRVLLADGYTLHVIVGSLNNHVDCLRALANSEPTIKLYENVVRMSDIMTHCDVAISAAGTTLYELCAVGVPTISFSFADNQIPGAKRLAELGIIEYANDVREGRSVSLQAVKQILTRYQDASYRLEQKKKMKELVDGGGANRLASYLYQLLQMKKEEDK